MYLKQENPHVYTPVTLSSHCHCIHLSVPHPVDSKNAWDSLWAVAGWLCAWRWAAF